MATDPTRTDALTPIAPYEADDRSLLLPFYKRLVVEPSVPWIPGGLTPNTISHAGHALCFLAMAILVGLWPERGWLYAASALLIQAYLWCDHADGAHARRTGQCSMTGEILDHGLDQLNTCYIAMLTAMALDAPPLAWVMFAIFIPGGPALTLWEQSRTGVFRLGTVNQVESLFVLSAALLVRGLLGGGFWYEISVGGLTLGLGLMLATCLVVWFGMVRGMARVVIHQQRFGALAPVWVYSAYMIAVATGAALGVLTAPAAALVAMAGNVFFGFRCLRCRLEGRAPRVSKSLVTVTGGLAALGALALAGQTLGAAVSACVAAAVIVPLGWLTYVDAREGLALVRRREEAPATLSH